MAIEQALKRVSYNPLFPPGEWKTYGGLDKNCILSVRGRRLVTQPACETFTRSASLVWVLVGDVPGEISGCREADAESGERPGQSKVASLAGHARSDTITVSRYFGITPIMVKFKKYDCERRIASRY